MKRMFGSAMGELTVVRREAVHQAAGTLVVMIDLALADLEAGGKICRTGDCATESPFSQGSVPRL